MAIYLDGHATTPLSPEARAALLTAWDQPGNAGSPHLAGRSAAACVQNARAFLAELIGADPSEVIFTSGATEANNLAILGVARAARLVGVERHRIIVSSVEHHAVLDPAGALVREGFEVVHAPVNAVGQTDLGSLETLLNPDTLLVCVMAANNETGVIQPVAQVAALAHREGAFMHCDAAQAVGKIPVNVLDWDVDYLSISAHKMYGPLGVGALYVASGSLHPQPLQWGGAQEGGLRSGTLPVPLIAGFGAASLCAERNLNPDAQHCHNLKASFLDELVRWGIRFEVVCTTAQKLPGSVALCIDGVHGEDLVTALANEVCISAGSACTTGQPRPSHVFLALGMSEEQANSTVRLAFGRYNLPEEIPRAAEHFAMACRRIRLATGGGRQ